MNHLPSIIFQGLNCQTSGVYPPKKNNMDNRKSTMNEDVNVFPIEIGDFPASYVSFQRCICHLAASPVENGDFFALKGDGPD